MRRAAAVTLALVVVAGLLRLPTSPPAEAQSAAAAAAPEHGLTGRYYTRDFPGSYDLKGFLPDAYGIPVGNKEPNATRIDPQIAFGKGKGFVGNDTAGGSQLVWWTPAEARAVVWKGYIRLPVAGTYYLTTASSGASAVYLNTARVSLNGGFGGSVPSGAFSLGESGTDAAYGPKHAQYVVPIPTPGPRVLPIEVRYLVHDSKGALRGIDLYWVRPDAPRDPSGKPLAEIVPGEVLFTGPPDPVEKPIVRGANSTISSDFLYLSAVPWSQATLTIRLADERGRPIAGHRVHVTTLQGSDGQSSPDEIIQPLQPTGADGITTAKVRNTGDQHTARLFATDLTDMVDVAQVAEVIVERRREWSLRPPGFAPYYDAKAMTVEPLPLRVGQPTRLTILLANRTPDTADVMAAFQARETNIGGVTWNAIGKAEKLTLAPGESRKVSVVWIPEKPDPHVCFKVDMSATFRSRKASADRAGHVLAVALRPSSAQAADTVSPPVTESLQQNIGPVVMAAPCGGVSSEYEIPENLKESAAEYAQRTVSLYRQCAAEASKEIDRLLALINQLQDRGRWPEAREASALLEKARDKFDACTSWANCMEYRNRLRTAVSGGGRDKPFCATEAKRTAEDLDVLVRDNNACVPCDPLLRSTYRAAIAEAKARLAALNRCVQDPPDAGYGQLAVAASDTVAEHVHAMTTSMERLQGARAAGDREWMARHLTAKRLYQQRIADSFRGSAKALRARVEKLPPDDPADVEKSRVARASLLERLRSGKPLPPEDRQTIDDAGVSQADIDRANAALLAAKELPPLKGPRARLIEMADSDQRSADELERLLAQPPEGGTEGEPGEPLIYSFVVGNPKDIPATVDLKIRRIAVPESWQLSIVDAPGPADRSARSGAPKPMVTEVTPGALYRVTLPAKAEVRVASMVLPVGETGVNTTARWAVEGRIGNELLGGVVHEMHVPALVADLQLPAIGSQPAPAAAVAGGKPGSRAPLLWAAAGMSIVVAGIILLAWRRKRPRV